MIHSSEKQGDKAAKKCLTHLLLTIEKSPFILHQVSQQDFPFGQVCKSVCGFN